MKKTIFFLCSFFVCSSYAPDNQVLQQLVNRGASDEEIQELVQYVAQGWRELLFFKRENKISLAEERDAKKALDTIMKVRPSYDTSNLLILKFVEDE